MSTCVIAEDEALLREALLEQLSASWPALEVLASCDDGASALEAIAEHTPDVAFLDIRMPGLSGLEVAAATAEISPHTHIVFVTAYDQYAIDAFERGAIDYLLKPVQPARLAATIERIKLRLSIRGNDDSTAELLRQLSQHMRPPSEQSPLTWITANAGRETRLILIDDVIYFRADNKYTTVVTADGEVLLRKPIRELLDVLDANVFKQIHRSTIVNMKAIASVVRDDTGKGTLKLRHRDETLVVSQPFMTLFRSM